MNFNRDVHVLHLPYLGTLALLYLRKSTQRLPRASAIAIVAASCVARIMEDLLARGSIRFMTGQMGWYITISILALLHARQIEALTVHADAHIAPLIAALKQMALIWHSAKMFCIGFEKILASKGSVNQSTDLNTVMMDQTSRDPQQNLHATSPTIDEITATDDISWTDCFPYVTMNTSPLIAALMANTLSMPFPELDASQFSHLFDLLDDLNPDTFVNLSF